MVGGRPGTVVELGDVAGTWVHGEDQGTWWGAEGDRGSLQVTTVGARGPGDCCDGGGDRGGP